MRTNTADRTPPPSVAARRIRIRGIVQGVGFRPFVFRTATAHRLNGWVLNGSDGVEIHVEGDEAGLDAFARDLLAAPPPAASIAAVDIAVVDRTGADAFEIRESGAASHPTARISPDLPVCDVCLAELFDPANRRYGYPYINCTACGPRYSIVDGLPYDRSRTTMAAWPMCGACRAEYENVSDRRFHAQPIACAACGPHLRLEPCGGGEQTDANAIAAVATLLAGGAIVAIKGIGGYHLACDAANPAAVLALRTRKFRKERPFAIMARDLETARRVVRLAACDEALLTSAPRPIVIAQMRRRFDHVAPDNADLGVMLPYTPVHHLLFAAGAPVALVMTSGNRSSEPIAYDDDDARERLSGIADAILVGERPIARRVDDSVVQALPGGPAVIRRARGLAPAIVARLPVHRPILAVGADLKNAPLLVVGGEAMMAPYLGDLEHYGTRQAFERALSDLARMYEIDDHELLVAHDAHPAYASTACALAWPAARHAAVQHHRAHVASVMAEHGDFDTRVVGVAFDGTGYGDDGSIWGGEFFVGSIREGFERAAHLRSANLIGGDAAAHWPVQAAAGFLGDLDATVDFTAPPFCFPRQYCQMRRVASAGVRVFPTTSVGRLFDTVAALLGFTRPVTFEGQAAIWLEHLARRASVEIVCPLPYVDGELDYRPALSSVVEGRRRGDDPAVIARAFHNGVARGVADAILALAGSHRLSVAAVSGGVFQNRLLLDNIRGALAAHGVQLLTNLRVPANDGGVSLGQAALAGVAAAP